MERERQGAKRRFVKNAESVRLRHLVLLGAAVVFSFLSVLISGRLLPFRHGAGRNFLTFAAVLFLIFEGAFSAAQKLYRRAGREGLRGMFRERTEGIPSAVFSTGAFADPSAGADLTPGKKAQAVSQIGRKALFLLAALLAVSFFCVHAIYKFDRTSEAVPSTRALELESGEVVEQTLWGFEPELLTSINVKFGTLREKEENTEGAEGAKDADAAEDAQADDHGTVEARLYEDGREIGSWSVLFALLDANKYHSFELEEPVTLRTDASYVLRIEEVYEGSSIVPLLVSTDTGPGYVRGGEKKEDRTVCFTLTYRDRALRGRFVRRGVLFGALVCLLILIGVKEGAVLAVILAALMLAYMHVCIPFMAPDEVNHFKRAFEVAEVGPVSQHMGDSGVGGNLLPRAISDYVRLYVETEEEDSAEENSAEGYSTAENSVEGNSVEGNSVEGNSIGNVSGGESSDTGKKPKILLDWDDTQEMEYGNTSLYSPLSYLPQAVGIRIACLFTDNVDSIYYAGRYANAFVNFLLCVFAICAAPFGKKVLFLLMTFPMTLQEMVSMSSDGITMSLCFFFLAYVLKLCYGEAGSNTGTFSYGKPDGAVSAGSYGKTGGAVSSGSYGKTGGTVSAGSYGKTGGTVSAGSYGKTGGTASSGSYGKTGGTASSGSYGKTGETAESSLYGRKRLRTVELAILGIAGILVAQLKIVYVVLLLLIFMIPKERFRSGKDAALFKGGAAGAAVLLNLIWLKISAGFLVEFRPGVDTPAQVAFVLKNPGKYCIITARTLLSEGRAWISTMICSNMGALTIGTTPISWVLALVLFVCVLCTCVEGPRLIRRRDPVLLIATFLLGSALIVSSIYVQWDALESQVILGVQGRYFTPILGTLAYAVILLRSAAAGGAVSGGPALSGNAPAASRSRGTYMYLLILLYNGIVLLDMASYFIEELWTL